MIVGQSQLAGGSRLSRTDQRPTQRTSGAENRAFRRADSLRRLKRKRPNAAGQMQTSQMKKPCLPLHQETILFDGQRGLLLESRQSVAGLSFGRRRSWTLPARHCGRAAHSKNRYASFETNSAVKRNFRNHWLTRCAFALIAVGAAFLLRDGLTLLAGGGLPTYITFYPAIMLSA